MRVSYDVVKIVKKKTLQLALKLDDVEEQIAGSKIVTFLSLFLNKKKKTKKK